MQLVNVDSSQGVWPTNAIAQTFVSPVRHREQHELEGIQSFRIARVPLVRVLPDKSATVSKPAPGVRSVYVNGVWTNLQKSQTGAQHLANALGREVTLVHNDTASAEGSGFFSRMWGKVIDIGNSLCGKVSSTSGRLCEPSVDSLTSEIVRAYRDPSVTTIDLHAHSQGTIVLKNSLTRARSMLGLQSAAAWKTGQEKFIISLYGAAELRFPPAVTTEYSHQLDIVSRLKDLAALSPLLAFFARSGVREVSVDSGTGLVQSHAFVTYAENIAEFFVAKHGSEGGASLGAAYKAAFERGAYSDEIFSEIVSLVPEAEVAAFQALVGESIPARR